MGLSIGITGGIMMFTMFVSLLLIPPILDKTLAISHTGNERMDIDDNIIKTQLSIEDIIAIETKDDVTFTISNIGTEKIWDFSKFDVFITYDRLNPTGTVTEKLDFDLSCPPQVSTWCINQIIDDFLEPNILNYNEELVVDVQLDDKIDNDGLVRIIVSAYNGVVATGSIKAQ